MLFCASYFFSLIHLLNHAHCRSSSVHQKAGYPEPWTGYNIMWAFHNVFRFGGERGRQAVCQAITPEVRAIFQYLVKQDVPWPTEDIGNHVRKWIAEMLNAAKGTVLYFLFFNKLIPCRRRNED